MLGPRVVCILGLLIQSQCHIVVVDTPDVSLEGVVAPVPVPIATGAGVGQGTCVGPNKVTEQMQSINQ